MSNDFEKDVVTLCQEMIRIPSVNYGEGKGNESAIAQYVVGKLSEVGIASKFMNPHLVVAMLLPTLKVVTRLDQVW